MSLVAAPAPVPPSPHAQLWPSPPRAAALAIVATIVGGLSLDARFGWPGQIAADIWALALFAWLYCCGETRERLALLLCLVISGAGEAVLSLVLGLYDYRHGNIPVFVPPGHALLMTLGLLMSRYVRTGFVAAVVAGALLWTVVAALRGWDTLGVGLSLMFAVCVAFSGARRLYAAMLLLSLIMEIYGTWAGCWTWRPTLTAPGLAGLTTTNPPVAAGAFYCVLDLLVLAALRSRPVLRLTSRPTTNRARPQRHGGPESPGPGRRPPNSTNGWPRSA